MRRRIGPPRGALGTDSHSTPRGLEAAHQPDDGPLAPVDFSEPRRFVLDFKEPIREPQAAAIATQRLMQRSRVAASAALKGVYHALNCGFQG